MTAFYSIVALPLPELKEERRVCVTFNIPNTAPSRKRASARLAVRAGELLRNAVALEMSAAGSESKGNSGGNVEAAQGGGRDTGSKAAAAAAI